MIGLKAPRVEADGDIVGKRIGACEIEVDQARQLVAEKEHVVGKKIGVDHALRTVARPAGLAMVKLARDDTAEVALDAVGELADRPVEMPPARDGERILAGHLEVCAGKVK